MRYNPNAMNHLLVDDAANLAHFYQNLNGQIAGRIALEVCDDIDMAETPKDLPDWINLQSLVTAKLHHAVRDYKVAANNYNDNGGDGDNVDGTPDDPTEPPECDCPAHTLRRILGGTSDTVKISILRGPEDLARMLDEIRRTTTKTGGPSTTPTDAADNAPAQPDLGELQKELEKVQNDLAAALDELEDCRAENTALRDDIARLQKTP